MRPFVRNMADMSVVLAIVMVAVALYCALRMVVPRWHDDRHAPTVDLTHVLMGVVMAAMFLVTIPVLVVQLALAAFVGAFGWFVICCLKRRARTLSLRVGATCAAMLFMLSPIPASAHAPGMAHAMRQPLGHSDVPTLLAIVALFAMIAVSVDALIEFSGRPATLHQRFSTMCEVSMAGAMGCMIVAMM